MGTTTAPAEVRQTLQQGPNEHLVRGAAVAQSKCSVCNATMQARRDRRWCSPPCKAELKRQYDRERYESNRAATIARAQSWYSENAERKRAYDAQYREDTRDRRLALKREWSKAFQATHPEAGRLRQAKRRATKVSNGAFVVTLKDLRGLLLRYDNRCGYCSSGFTDGNPLEWDHIIPIVRGGQHSIGNLMPSCRQCNRSKLRRTITEWRTGKVVAGWDNLKALRP